MFVFKKEQQTFDFGGVTIGGNPGEFPTVMIGGLFFKSQEVVEDVKKGLFKKDLAKEWVDLGIHMSEETGHPLIIQVYGRTPEAMENHISWLTENFDGPFMFESTISAARLRGIEYCSEAGLEDRAIYNSLNLSTKDAEKSFLHEKSIDKAVVLGWSPRATSLNDRMETITNMTDDAKKLGITKMLVDPATMPVGAGYGLDYRTILTIKSELGLPTCLGPHNAPSAWKFLRRPELNTKSTHLAAIVASTAVAQILATDSVMYGSMKRTKEVFAATSLIANAIASAAAEANRSLGREVELFESPTFE